MKWGIMTVIVLSALFSPPLHAQEKIGFQDVEMYYFQPISIDDPLTISNVSSKMILSYEAFQFNETIKNEISEHLNDTHNPLSHELIFEKVRNITEDYGLTFRANGADNYNFYIYPTLFVAEYKPNRVFDLNGEIGGFEEFIHKNVTPHLSDGIKWKSTQYPRPQLTYTNSYHYPGETRVVLLKVGNADNIMGIRKKLYQNFPTVKYYDEIKIDCPEKRELYVFKAENKLIIISNNSLFFDDFLPVFGLLDYIYPYEEEQLEKVEKKIKDYESRTADFEAVISSRDRTLIDETQNNLTKYLIEYSLIKDEINQLIGLSKKEGQLLNKNDACYFKIYGEIIENHNNFFSRDVRDLETRNQNIINDYKRLSVQLQSRGEFLEQMNKTDEQLQKMDDQINWAIRGVWVAVIAAVLATLGLLLTWNSGRTQTPIFEKIKEYLRDLRSQKKNKQ